MRRQISSSTDERPWFIIRIIRMAHRESFSDKPGPIDIWLQGLGRFGCETYYPLLRELRHVPRRMLSRKQRANSPPIIRPRLAPFLPGYVFVRGEKAAELRRVPCVTDYIRTTEKRAAQISDALIVKMRAREEEGAIPGGTPAQFIFSANVVEGPLKNALADLSVPARLRLTMDHEAAIVDSRSVRTQSARLSGAGMPARLQAASP
jgi:hypothetical protein